MIYKVVICCLFPLYGFCQPGELKKLTEENKELKAIIKETNRVFLRELFDNKYVKNASYFNDTDLTEDDTTKYKNSIVLINNIRADETNKDVEEMSKQALDFSKAYLVLYRVKKNILTAKYDSIKIAAAITELSTLISLPENSKLKATQGRLINFLKNYAGNTCQLKTTLAQYKRGDQSSSAMKAKYSQLEINPIYKDYPYLVGIIRKIKSNVNDYTEDDLPCSQPVSPGIETETKENKSTPAKEVKTQGSKPTTKPSKND